ncbi:hypothetical protein AVEN_172829-1 [Araneus ventricosus]|uniref:Uncharacterized protein n=1 Tax=Araneus ventricosus TaxID=182803 RepID=A0A4Y2BI46_ARAVE|nr:hypothetical protein AVEN_172829-1 [Araneus ventricosus]
MDLGIAFYLIRDPSICERTTKLFGCGDGDRLTKSLVPPYSGPHLVVSRSLKHFTIQVGPRQQTVSIDRLKPAFQPFGVSFSI